MNEDDTFTEDLFDLDESEHFVIKEDLRLSLKAMRQKLSVSPVPHQEILDALDIRFLKAFVSEWKLDIDKAVSEAYESSMVYNYTTNETIPFILSSMVKGFESRETGFQKLKQYIHCHHNTPEYHRYLALAYENIFGE
jgi:hypothetical protein